MPNALFGRLAMPPTFDFDALRKITGKPTWWIVSLCGGASSGPRRSRIVLACPWCGTTGSASSTAILHAAGGKYVWGSIQAVVCFPLVAYRFEGCEFFFQG